jgi:Fe-S-cluster containining protein
MSLLEDDERRALRALYDETDALLRDHTCESSTDCCRFKKTGREPYPTAIELALLFEATRKKGVAHVAKAAPKKRLPVLVVPDEGNCPMLGQDGRCRVYEARPFGCRTFFCNRRMGPAKMPRKEIVDLGRRIADLSARAFPRDPQARPLVRALEAGPQTLVRARR